MALLCNIAMRNLQLISFTSKISFQPSRQFKSALKIKWVRPEPVPSIKPEVSGDLAGLGTIDMSQFPTKYKDSKELQSADELVQRINTLEFFGRQVLKEEFTTQFVNRVKAHNYDDNSTEVKLAKLTVTIRNLQIHMENHPRDRINKQKLKISIDKRTKYLTELRNTDYKKFEWLLEKLDLEHKAYAYKGQERVERKRSLRRLTMLYIIKLKNEKLLEYKAFLDSQKEGFLKDKLEKLFWIKSTEEKHGVVPTISEEDIETVRKELEDLKVVKHKEISD